MRLGVRSKLFLVLMGLVVTCVATVLVYLNTVLEPFLTQRVRDDLLVAAHLVEQAASSHDGGLEDFDRWDRLADDLGQRARARVSFIRTDGAVIGDSAVPSSHLPWIENHIERPEVQGALVGTEGSGIRFSTTMNRRMLYAAAPFRQHGEVVGVARVGLPLTEVDDFLSGLHRTLFFASLLAVVMAIVLSTAGAHWASRSARMLAEAARRMADGDLSVRSGGRGTDEFAELGRSLDSMATSLSASLEALRSERDRLGSILEGMQEGVLVLDGENRVALLNPALREMLLLESDVENRPASEVLRQAELLAIFGRARVGKSPVAEEVELSGIKPRRLLVRAQTLPGEETSLLAVLVDVTDLRRLETLRRDFVANASHELRTPVTAIRSAAETLQEAASQDPEGAKIFMQIIERNAERLHQLVQDLLDLSRIESREFRLDPEPLDLATSIDHATGLIIERARRKGIRVDPEVARHRPPVLADRRALEQVLANLLDNAIKYCPSGARVTVRGEEEGDFVRLSVVDTGPGIEPTHLPRLFERFYRVDAGRSREVGGTGLGLAIVKHLVDAMGGTVAVESTPGKGTTFSFTLPRAGEVVKLAAASRSR